MTAKEAIEKIRTMLFAEQPVAVVEPPVAEPKAMFADYKLKDGSIVKIDTLDVGGQVTVNEAPAPDGDYELEDGTKLSVAGGLISEIEKGEEPAPLVNPLEEQMAKVLGNYSAQDDRIKQLTDTVSKQNDTIKEMFSLLETVANTSVQKPIETAKKSWDDMTPLEQFRAQKN